VIWRRIIGLDLYEIFTKRGARSRLVHKSRLSVWAPERQKLRYRARREGT